MSLTKFVFFKIFGEVGLFKLYPSLAQKIFVKIIENIKKDNKKIKTYKLYFIIIFNRFLN